MRILGLITSILVVSFSSAQPSVTKFIQNKDANSLLWQVSGNGLKHPSYLFGTFHLLCKDDIHFSNQLKTAIANTDEVYMELDMNNPATIKNGFKLLYMKGNKRLKDFYDSAGYKRLQNYFNDSLQMPIDFMANMKPYFLMALLYPKMLPCEKASGVEEELLKLAKEDNKKIKGLETMEFQASVFDSIPYAEQAKALLKSVDSIAAFKSEFDMMLKIYKEQKINQIGSLFSKTEFGEDEHEDILLDNRNKKWVSKLKVIMKNKSAFVAVGAGHLVGVNGLIKLLRKNGYTVIPLLNK